MKIVYISSSSIPSRTANSIHVMKMCQAFAKQGHSVTILTPAFGKVERGVTDVFSFYGVDCLFNIKRVKVPNIRSKGYIYGYYASKIARNLSPDLIYGRNLLGIFFSIQNNFPVILETHSPIRDIGFIPEILFKMLINKKLIKIVVITHSLKEYYLKKYKNIENKILVAPDASDPLPLNIKPFKLPNKNKRLQVGYVGHLYKGKGFEVIRDLAQKCSWADFHLVGGTDNDINKLNNLFLTNNLFIHGFKPYNEATSYRIAFDILLLPNQYDVRAAGKGNINIGIWTSPLKLFEYMATGKAIIASDLPVLREILTHGKNALLCIPNNISDWEKALVILRDNHELRISLGNKAFEDFQKHYSWDVRAINILKQFDVID